MDGEVPYGYYHISANTYMTTTIKCHNWNSTFMLLSVTVYLQAFEECKIGYAKTRQTLKLKDYRVITEIDLQLEPLCTEVHSLTLSGLSS